MTDKSLTIAEASRRALRSANLLLEASDDQGAINRAYYAIFYAARAYLLTRHSVDPRSIKTHAGLIGAFGNKAIIEDGMDRELGRMFNAAEEMRVLGDYDVADELRLTHSSAISAVKDAERFVEVVLSAMRVQR